VLDTTIPQKLYDMMKLTAWLIDCYLVLNGTVFQLRSWWEQVIWKRWYYG
jgi:hypothetical protein